MPPFPGTSVPVFVQGEAGVVNGRGWNRTRNKGRGSQPHIGSPGRCIASRVRLPSPRWICSRSTCLRGVAVGPAERRWSAEDAMVRSRSTAGKPVNRPPIGAALAGRRRMVWQTLSPTRSTSRSPASIATDALTRERGFTDPGRVCAIRRCDGGTDFGRPRPSGHFSMCSRPARSQSRWPSVSSRRSSAD